MKFLLGTCFYYFCVFVVGSQLAFSQDVPVQSESVLHLNEKSKDIDDYMKQHFQTLHDLLNEFETLTNNSEMTSRSLISSLQLKLATAESLLEESESGVLTLKRDFELLIKSQVKEHTEIVKRLRVNNAIITVSVGLGCIGAGCLIGFLIAR